MKKWKVWQVGWENEAREFELEDDVGCVICETVGIPPGADPVVMAFAPADAPEDVTYQHLEHLAFGVMAGCRRATEKEIEEARAEAEGIRAGTIKELKLTPEERKRLEEERGTVGRIIRDNAMPLLGSFLSIFGKTNQQRTVGNALISSWAADAVNTMGKKARAKKWGESDEKKDGEKKDDEKKDDEEPESPK